MTTRRIKVEQSDPPVSKTVLAEAVRDIGAAARELNASGLNEKAIIVLLHDFTRIGKRDIKAVLDGLRQLEGWYCR